MSLALESLWSDYYAARLLLDIPPHLGLQSFDLENYKPMQMEHADRTSHDLKSKWYPAVLRLFMSPPPHPSLPSLVAQSEKLFKAIRVQMTRQVSGLLWVRRERERERGRTAR